MKPRAVVPLPDLVVSPSSGLRVRAELVGDEVRHVVEVAGGRSRRAMVEQVRRAQRVLADVPQVLTRVEVVVDAHSAAALRAAAAKRARRAALRRGGR